MKPRLRLRTAGLLLLLLLVTTLTAVSWYQTHTELGRLTRLHDSERVQSLVRLTRQVLQREADILQRQTRLLAADAGLQVAAGRPATDGRWVQRQFLPPQQYVLEFAQAEHLWQAGAGPTPTHTVQSSSDGSGTTAGLNLQADEGRLALRASEPVRDPQDRIVGWVHLGRQLDDTLLRGLAAQIRSELAVWTDQTPVAASHPELKQLATSLPRASALTLAPLAGQAGVWQTTMPFMNLPLHLLVRADTGRADAALAQAQRRIGLLHLTWGALAWCLGALGLIYILRRLDHLKLQAQVTAMELTGQAVEAGAQDEVEFTIDVLDNLTDSLIKRNRELSTSLQRNAATVHAIPDMIVRVDLLGVVLECPSERGLEPYLSANTIKGRTLTEAMNLNESHAFQLALETAIVTGEAQSADFTLDGVQGERQYEARLSRVGPAEALVLIRDVTSTIRLRKALAVVNASSQGIVTTSAKGVITSVNPACCRLLGYSADEMVGQRWTTFHQVAPAPSNDAALVATMEKGESWEGEITGRRASGESFPVWLTSAPLRAENGQVIEYVTLFTDITERKAAEARILHIAHHDALTGLPNRLSLGLQLNTALSLAQREQRQLAVMFLDMDRFKLINDTLGHDVGDGLLKQVAQRLTAALRESDIVSRLGGDEFVMVLQDLHGRPGAARIAHKVLMSLGKPYTVDGHVLHSTPSLGLAIYPDDGRDADTLMKNADTAMYRAKELGRNNVQFYTTALNDAAQARLDLEREMHDALNHGQFVLHFQPMRSLRDNSILAMEALVRWQHPQRGLLLPESFIPAAEDSGLIHRLGRWVMVEACRQVRIWRLLGVQNVMVSVNLSARQLKAPDLCDKVRQVLEQEGVQGRDLMLEFTESGALQDSQRSIADLLELRTMGVKLAIDNFGSGYASLNDLKRLPVHTLKLDRSFVHEIERDPNDLSICKATITLAHKLGLAVVAEGVEELGLKHLLKDNLCDYVQGQVVGPPMRAQEAEDLLRKTLNPTAG